jgi:hypothetical protein
VKVLYVWPNSTINTHGINDPALVERGCHLAPAEWNNPDHVLAAIADHVYVVSATAREIRMQLIPAIRNADHIRTCISLDLAAGRPGLPFLISRNGLYIQRIKALPWRLVEGTPITCKPFLLYERPYTIYNLQGLYQIGTPLSRSVTPTTPFSSWGGRNPPP